MASMEIYDSTRETPGCAARASFVIKSAAGIVKGRHCRKDAPAALKAQNDQERTAPPLKGVVSQ